MLKNVRHRWVRWIPLRSVFSGSETEISGYLIFFERPTRVLIFLEVLNSQLYLKREDLEIVPRRCDLSQDILITWYTSCHQLRGVMEGNYSHGTLTAPSTRLLAYPIFLGTKNMRYDDGRSQKVLEVPKTARCSHEDADSRRKRTPPLEA